MILPLHCNGFLVSTGAGGSAFQRGGGFGLAICMLVALVSLGNPVSAQHRLYFVDDETTVRGIAFRFPETQTFDSNRLREEIFTQAPSFFDRVRRALPLFSSPVYEFDPVELQRDVVRLRQFYQRNGFLHTRIDYPASQLDTTSNSIRVIFTVWEGPPLIIQNIGFESRDGSPAVQSFAEEDQEDWIRFRDRLGVRIGSRYTEFERTRVQDEVLTWLQDQGYAFAEVTHRTNIDSVASVVDLRIVVEPGPVAFVDEVLLQGNESVSREVVLRETALKPGDRFSRSKLITGQRRLFALNLFRVAVADVPEQEVSDEVDIRYRVSEARPRHVSAQTGYGRNGGIQFLSDWRHRNFLGGARELTISLGARTGVWARPVTGLSETRSFSASASLRQPYLFVPDLSGIITPFYTWQHSPSQDIEFQEIGLSTSVIYEILPFRTIRLQNTFSRAYPLGDTQISVPDPEDETPVDGIEVLDIYDRSIWNLSATFGRADNFIEASRGFIIRPSFEVGGLLIARGVEYAKGNLEVSGYQPLGRRFNISGRVQGGIIEPFGRSRDQRDPQIEYRFERIRFFAGGASDVRGWGPGRLGPEIPRARLARDEEGDLILEDVEGGGRRIALQRTGYEPIGGLAKLSGNVELRMPFPGLGENWQTAAFVDFGRVFAKMNSTPSPDISGVELPLEPARLRIGVGGGIRFRTPVGYIRLDIAMKANPSDTDLQDPAETFRWVYRDELRELNPLEPEPDRPDRPFRRLFQFHLSLGQAF